MKSKILPYLQLMRLANVFTAIADIVMGVLFVNQLLYPWPVFALLCVTSALLYTSGMILNDVFDFEKDKAERAERPIPAGLVSYKTALVLGFGFMIAGLVFAAVAGFVSPSTVGAESDSASNSIKTFQLVRIPIVAGILALCILAYDWWFKKTPLNPLFMGSCRFFNVLLGMSAGSYFVSDYGVGGFGVGHLMAAGGIGIYISGVTIFARTEAQISNRGMLIFALTVMLGGISMLGALPFLSQEHLPFLVNPFMPTMWPMLLALMSLSVIRNCIGAIADPVPKRVQAAVKQSILTLIFLDASMCVLVVPNQPWYAVGVLALLVPMIWLGRFIKST